MTLFLAVMVTDVIILDVFNTLGMPTSTTVSLVFELLVVLSSSTLKMYGDDSLNYGVLLNSNKALEVIMGIFSSVIIAFVFGAFVMWLSVSFSPSTTANTAATVSLSSAVSPLQPLLLHLHEGFGQRVPPRLLRVRDYIDQNPGFSSASPSWYLLL